MPDKHIRENAEMQGGGRNLGKKCRTVSQKNVTRGSTINCSLF